MAPPQTASQPPSTTEDSASLGPWGIAIIAFGLTIRAWLTITGRSPFDGDEGIMGVMAYHVSQFERFPVYFYNQHYLGSLEIPPVVLLDWLGGPGWIFSIWPMRIVAAFYFVALCWVHFRLCAKFFGAPAARWMMFFLCVAPVYWMDYSVRLRHAPMMMFLGELIALTTIGLIEQWKDGRKVSGRRVFTIGLLSGLAWWHYQLSIVYLASAVFLVLAFSSFASCWIRPLADLTELTNRDAKRSFVNLWTAARLALLAACVVLMCGLTLGWMSQDWNAYPLLITSMLLVLGAVCFSLWRGYRWQIRSIGNSEIDQHSTMAALHRFSPAILTFGFFVGMIPTIYYMVTLNEEFWVSRIPFSFNDFGSALKSLFLLQFASMLEFVERVRLGPGENPVSAKTYVNFLLYFVAIYSMVKMIFFPARREHRIGAAYFFMVLGVVLLLHVIAPRQTGLDSPRFLLPAFSFTSVALGWFAYSIVVLARSQARRRGAMASQICVGIIVTAALFLWGGRWIDMRQYELDWPSGQKKEVVEVIEAMREHDIDRLLIGSGTSRVLFAYELQFACGLEMRINRWTLGDRLEGRVDESRYKSELYSLFEWADLQTHLDLQTPGIQTPFEDGTPQAGFRVGEFFIFPTRLFGQQD